MILRDCDVAIIGGGITGLSAAYLLERAGRDYRLFEALGEVGGLLRSVSAEGFTFDYTGHLLHFTKVRIRDFVKGLLGESLSEHRRRAWVYSNGVFTRYPFQRNLYGLPRDVVKECLLDYIEASAEEATEKMNFGPWTRAAFGSGISRHFMIPYNRKLWQTDPDELTCDWVGRFVPGTTPVDTIRGAFEPSADDVGYNARFFYPRTGGIEVLPRSIAASLTRIALNKRVTAVNPGARRIRFEDGDSCGYMRILSTMPLPELVRCLGPVPREVEDAASKLACASVLDVNLGLDLEELTDKHWVYVPDPEMPFYRVGFPHNFSPSLVPRGKTSVYAEISYLGDRSWQENAVIRDVVSGMSRMGFPLSMSDVVIARVIPIKHAYVIYDSERASSLGVVKGFLETKGIMSAGRFGSWSYLSMEDSMEEGLRAGESLLG